MTDFEQIFRQHYEELVRYAVKFLNNQHHAEDLVQDAFVDIWDNKSDWNQVVNKRAYLFQMVKNRSINFLKKTFKEVMHEELQDTSDLQPISFELQELEKISKDILSQLPVKTQAIFRMSRFSDMTYDEIAKEMDLSVKSIEYHMSKSIDWIKKNLDKHWYMIWLLMGIIND
ncbi:MAG: RNA polymerase sigma-70 factor [Carboxylicivirga sp.]|jgi:RNA polymerase sigma-70 factor (ECF subfamily)|nr:RNA polymerase sigma-70 factor [Carboxylicivirga sp.]